VGVRRFVSISTDKAAQPTNVMGASKWLAEQIVLDAAPKNATYCAVRFGNVLGSRGSVIPTFERQIEAGGPVTVTDPHMTRYFMSVSEAVRLVLLGASVASGAELLALDMGEQVNILELAERMIRLSGYRVGHDIEIDVVGPRPGENAEESLIGPAEHGRAYGDMPIIAITPVRLGSGQLGGVLERLSKAAAAGNQIAARSLLLDVASPAAQARPA
jgi:FlaA1/EpsC-like NDP-sugar epimerase